MRKSILLLLLLTFVSGCQSVEDLKIEDTLKTFAYEENDINIYRVGYKYYLPKGMQVDSNTLYNEIITNNKYTFYLYVDMVNYFSNTENKFKKNTSAYYSEKFEYNEKIGYLEINLTENNQYLIEIMYNYAKIEVIVVESDINESIIYASNILKSIRYNGTIIENMLGENILDFTDEEYNIFNTTKSDSKYLDNTQVLPDEEINNYDQNLIN